MRTRVLALAVLLSTCGARPEALREKPNRRTPEQTTTQAGPAADCVETSDLTAIDSAFEPICAMAAPGDELTITNDVSLPHTFTIRDTDEVLDPGAEATVAVPDTLAANAESEFHCRFHPGMVGYLFLTEG